MSQVATDTPPLFDCRNAFASAIEKLADSDPRIVAVVNDSVGSSKLSGFKARFPDRLINVGIAEQNMVGVGAGLANGGFVPFVSAASCFLTARAMEQVKADIAYSNVNVKLVGQSSGVAYGELGATHHSIEDVAWLRLLPNLTILVPSDPWETVEAMRAAAAIDGPVFVRISRAPVPELTRPEAAAFQVGRAEVLREGGDVAVIANGVMVHRALEAAERLTAQGVAARVINMSTIAPLDVDAIVAAGKTGAVVTVEEASTRGGLGGAVAEVLSTKRPTPLRMLGFPTFAPTGSVEFLFEHFGLTADGIVAAVHDVLSDRRT